MTARSLLPRRWRTATPAVVLGAALIVSCLLGYQALASERAHRAAVSRALDNVAGVAAWEARRIVRERLQHAVNMTLWPASRIGTARRPFPAPTILSQADRKEMDCDCAMPLAGQFYFRLDLQRDEIVASGEMPPTGFHDTLIATLEPMIGPRIQPGWRGMLLETLVGADRRMVALTVLPDATGAPALAYGVVFEPSALGPVILLALADAVLLPPAMEGGTSDDSLFLIRAVTPGGTRLLQAGDRPATPHLAEESLGPFLGDIRIEVGLRGDRLDRLALVPNSRTYVLLGLLLGTIGLFTMAFLQLRRRQELLALRNRFIADVSHELRTPLAQIRMFTQTLRLGRARSDAERRRFLEFLEADAHRLGNLVENILRFDRLQRGNDAVIPKPTAVDRLLTDVTQAFAPLATAQGVGLSADVEQGLEAQLDRDAMYRVLLNLLDNAVKYGPPAQTIVIGAAAADGYVRIWVQDEGPGVPPKARARVFEPFARLDRPVEGAVGGSGLGLAVVRDLVAQQHGRVWVTNGPTGGARFCIEVPRADPPSHTQAVPRAR